MSFVGGRIIYLSLGNFPHVAHHWDSSSNQIFDKFPETMFIISNYPKYLFTLKMFLMKVLQTKKLGV